MDCIDCMFGDKLRWDYSISLPKNKAHMKKSLLFICMLPVLLLLGGVYWIFKEPDRSAHAREKTFEELMGSRLSSWKHVRSSEDREALNFYKGLFEKGRAAAFQPVYKIPKIAHFIWLGPKEFPEASKENIASWVRSHPDWKFFFWTDRDRPLPHPHMEMHRVEEVQWRSLADCFGKSDNFAEKSDLLRYEILFAQGGVYADHDVKCLKALDPLLDTHDFFCGLELPAESPLKGAVHVTNNLIAVIPEHPIIGYCLEWLPQHWERIQKLFPGDKKESIIARVANRTFSAFDTAVRTLADNARGDMVFPAFYFNAPKDGDAFFTRHLYAGTWFENETAFEKMVRERLMAISKKNNKIFLYLGALCGLNLLLMGYFIASVVRLEKKFQSWNKVL